LLISIFRSEWTNRADAGPVQASELEGRLVARSMPNAELFKDCFDRQRGDGTGRCRTESHKQAEKRTL
jgi:hypothetical protein